jgi:hypothetical protein
MHEGAQKQHGCSENGADQLMVLRGHPLKAQGVNDGEGARVGTKAPDRGRGPMMWWLVCTV